MERKTMNPLGGVVSVDGGAIYHDVDPKNKLHRRDMIEVEFLDGVGALPCGYRPGQRVFVTSALADTWCNRSNKGKGVARPYGKKTGETVTDPGVVTK